MYCVKKIKPDIFWVGANDRKIALFESIYPVENGVSYNSYLILDEKTVLLDTVDKVAENQLYENIEHLLGKRDLDYVVINHMEPDHCAALGNLIRNYPKLKIIGNKKTITMFSQFFDFDISNRVVLVEEGDEISFGKHTLKFFMAPMVHWPEVMVSYETSTKTLFSADAFGSFGALSGNIFADEMDFEHRWIDEARRYYTNIVGKYGDQVQALLKKAATLDIDTICPLHGPMWRKNIGWYIDKHMKWSQYIPEQTGVLIAYASVYGNTESAANILAGMLDDKGIKNIALYDVSVTHSSVILSEAFKYSHLVFASTTYNSEIFFSMDTLLRDIKSHNLQNRTVAFIENGSWAPTSGKLMKEIMSSLKNMTIIEDTVSIKSSLKEEQIATMDTLAQSIADSVIGSKSPIVNGEKIQGNAMFKLSYGLFVLSTKTGDKDNGCIINTVMQVTDTPKRVQIAINRANHTHDMILKSLKFNISILGTDTPFEIFQRFGFKSGIDTDKFEGLENIARTENDVIYLTQYANAVLSCNVISTQQLETHTVFTAEITEAKVLSNTESVTYAYYFANIKPKPPQAPQNKKGYVCKICGYVYEGDPLPADFICPICKHGAEDFEPLS